ncbi:MAG TPA: hydrogenase nickel incorporation protein HypB [Kofleriaceae bacterium]|jgi:hydrogenase nickel incorporation protein HypB
MTCGCSETPLAARFASSGNLISVDPAEHRRIRVEQDILARNTRGAERNRGWLAERRCVALNIVSSPGSGKTTLLERTIRDLASTRVITVIEGDQATANDADRIRAAGARAVQINTGTGCHLDAEMVARALPDLDPPAGSLVMIENVGNLVCPALFDLGERAKVLVASVTEGDDKPLKYPHMFRAARLILLSKIDLAPYVPFDRARFAAAVTEVNPHATIIELSATRGDHLDAWYAWLNEVSV